MRLEALFYSGKPKGVKTYQGLELFAELAGGTPRFGEPLHEAHRSKNPHQIYQFQHGYVDVQADTTKANPDIKIMIGGGKKTMPRIEQALEYFDTYVQQNGMDLINEKGEARNDLEADLKQIISGKVPSPQPLFDHSGIETPKHATYKEKPKPVKRKPGVVYGSTKPLNGQRKLL